ncbi:MAG: hypothetical protein AAGK22_07430 [Acidobacteriota bacterium]
MTKERRESVRRTLNSAVAGALLFAACLDAQEERESVAREGAVSETLTVRETTLHVRVRTPNRAIEELTEDRFRVLFGERELPILAFEELSFETAKRGRSRREAEPESPATPREAPGRSVLIVIDQLFTPRPYLNDTVSAVRKNLDRLAEGDRVALMTLDIRARLIHHFTSDRAVISAGLDLLEASFDREGRNEVDSLVRALQDLVKKDDSYQAASAIGLRAALGIANSPNVSITAGRDQSLFDNRARARFDDGADALFSVVDINNLNSLAQTIQASTASFSDALRLVADVPGPRYSLLFSGGVQAFREIVSEESSSPLDPRTGAGASTLASYQALSYVLQANGWTVQAFDVSGVGERSQSFSMESSGPNVNDSQQIAALPELALSGGLADASDDTLFFLANETGGDFYNQFNSISGALRESLQSTSHHYRIVVALEATEKELDRRRTLRVEVADLPRRARVTHSLTADWALPPNLRRLDAVEAARSQLVSGRSEAQLPHDVAQLGVFLIPHSETSRRAVVVLDADMGALRRRMRPAAGEYRLKVHALAHDPETPPGRESDFFDLFEIDAGWSADSGEPASRLLVAGDLIVPCAGARIRMRFADPIVVDGILREHVVPDTCGQQLSWASAFLGEGEEFAFAVESDFSLADAQQNPFHQNGSTYFPDLRRMVERGSALTLLAFGPRSELQLRRRSNPSTAVPLPIETSSRLSETARLETAFVDAEGGLYELTLPSQLPSGALLRVLDFDPGAAASEPPEER